MTRGIAALLLLALGLAPFGASADRPPVYVTVSLMDRNSLYIEDLSRDEITLLENGKPQKIELFAKAELPTVYGLLFDRDMLGASWESYSVRRSGASSVFSARDIAYELIDRYLGRQTLWVGVFDRHVEVAFDFGADGFRAKDAIQKLRGRDRPAESFLHGALVESAQKLASRPEKRRVLFLFVEEVDTETAYKVKPLKNLYGSSNIELFVVCFASKLGSRRPGRLLPPMTEGLLKEVAHVTAGDCYMASNYREHVDDLSRRLFNHVRTLYTFGYQSSVAASKVFDLEIRCSREGARIRHHPSAISEP